MQRYTIVEDLINKMTVEQKVAQMMQIPYTMVTQEQAITWVKRGVGSFLHVFGEKARALKKIAIEETENKIPILFGIDAIHGHCLNNKSTIFPTQLSMACSFNKNLVQKMARATAEEVSADGVHWTFSPVLCLGRDLRWGRVDETFGEDKFLVGELGSAMIKGYQGENLRDKGSVLACAKHYIGYGEATGGRDSYDTEITERKMRDCFLQPFEKAVESNCKTFMTAYGSLDGTPCTANKRLLKDILKKELKFNGFIVTDWDNISHLINEQRLADNYKDASKIAVECGNDMMMTTQAFYDCAIELINNGEIDIELINDSVRRILNAKYELGLFENPYKEMDYSCFASEEHLEINKQLAEECVVLLKNENILPLKKEYKNIAVIGESANDIVSMYGNWTCFDSKSDDANKMPVRPYTTLLEGMQDCGQKLGFNVQYAKGIDIVGEDYSFLDEAVELANDSDIIVFACGDNKALSGEGVDIASPELSKNQQILFEKLSKTNKPIVLVLISSKPLCISEQVEKSKGVITCFNGGQFGGECLAKVIFGEINPSGKLPISFAQHIGQQPTYYNYLSGWHCSNYVDMPKETLFTFGEGLSYTKFEYFDATFNSETLTLSVKVKNVGNVDGKEITQVYFKDVISSVMTPIKQLIAFTKTDLKVGEQKELTFKFSKEDFSFINANLERVTENGKFEIMVGGSSRDTDLIKIEFNND